MDFVVRSPLFFDPSLVLSQFQALQPRHWNRRVSAGLRAVKALSGFIYLRAKALEQGGFHSSERKRRKRSGLRGSVLV